MDRVFVGTGLIGRGLAEAALARGERVGVFNRTRSAAQPLAELGATVFETLGEAGSACGRVHLALTADVAVDSVLSTLVPVLDASAVVVDHSTTSVGKTRQRGNRLKDSGTRFVHAPVFMSPANCKKAEGSMLAAGPKEVFAEVSTELSRMTGHVNYVGDDYGRAATLKLIGNSVSVNIALALADAFRIADAQGVARSECLEFLLGFDMNRMFRGRGPNMVDGNHVPGWAVNTAKKDVGLMLEAADGAPLLSLPTAWDCLGRLESILPNADISAVVDTPEGT